MTAASFASASRDHDASELDLAKAPHCPSVLRVFPQYIKIWPSDFDIGTAQLIKYSAGVCWHEKQPSPIRLSLVRVQTFKAQAVKYLRNLQYVMRVGKAAYGTTVVMPGFVDDPAI